MSIQEILNWGIDVIRLLQLFTADFFVLSMKGITLLGNETAYLIMLPFVLWCVEFRTGARTGLVFLLSAYLNFFGSSGESVGKYEAISRFLNRSNQCNILF